MTSLLIPLAYPTAPRIFPAFELYERAVAPRLQDDDDLSLLLEGVRRVVRRALGPGFSHPASEPDRFLKIDEVARRLAISRSRAYELINDGRLPARRIGRALRVSERALENCRSRLTGTEEDEHDGKFTNGEGSR